MNSSTNSTALTAAGGTPPSGPRIAQSSRDLGIHSSDGGSRERPFVPADAAGGKSGTVTARRANRKAEPGLEVGASQMPGSSMSFGLAEPIIAGQALSPSDAFQFAGHRSSRPANSQGFGSEPSISPEFRERVAMAACVAFFAVIAAILGVAAFFISMLIDWYGVGETAFRFADLG